jgi:hypothetical protein
MISIIIKSKEYGYLPELRQIISSGAIIFLNIRTDEVFCSIQMMKTAQAAVLSDENIKNNLSVSRFLYYTL